MATENGPEGDVDVLMVGTGEYTTGYVHGAASTSDKGAGVVALVLLDLRRRGLGVGRLGLCGTSGAKFAGIRAHLQRAIGDVYAGFDDLSMDTFPEAADAVDPQAYRRAVADFPPGSAVTVFTPDDTHFDIALAAVEAGHHVLVTKPIVKTLDEHRRLAAAARERNVLVMVEVHKRFDPMYVDARDRIAALGDFSFFTGYMSQPKSQLETFRAWAGKASDISYYLNSHHVDFHEWALRGRARPVSVVAMAATGVAQARGIDTEDTITLTVQWQNVESGALGVATYTSSWVAPPSDVHSQQRFFYMGHSGEVRVDQAHRGYSAATDADGFRNVNPLFMKYAPSGPNADQFAGQDGYGYRSIAAFVAAVRDVRAGRKQPADFDAELPTAAATAGTTAILEAGRRSLDEGGRRVAIEYGDEGAPCEPTGLV